MAFPRQGVLCVLRRNHLALRPAPAALDRRRVFLVRAALRHGRGEVKNEVLGRRFTTTRPQLERGGKLRRSSSKAPVPRSLLELRFCRRVALWFWGVAVLQSPRTRRGEGSGPRIG